MDDCTATLYLELTRFSTATLSVYCTATLYLELVDDCTATLYLELTSSADKSVCYIVPRADKVQSLFMGG